MNNISAIVTASYTTSKEADLVGKELKKWLGCENNYEIARLSLGRSLGLPGQPPAAPDGKGQALRGMQLFGQESDSNYLWISLLGEQLRQNGEESFTTESLQRLVRDHWHRGALLLAEDWKEAGEDFSEFLERLASKAELPETIPGHNNGLISDDEWTETTVARPVDIQLGTVEETSTPFTWTVNGVGYSPHMAIMGQAGSGKTRTMLEILKQLRTQTSCPVILLDLGKGDLAENAALAEALGARVLKVPDTPIPLDMFFGSTKSEEEASDSVMGFRDSFSKVMQSKPGAKQLDAMRSALKPLFSRTQGITLGMVRDELQSYYDDNRLKTDSVISTINDLTERHIFNPELSPAEFFSHSWIITFANARDTIKNLSVYMLLDALNGYLKRIPESPTDDAGNRGLRIVLAVDEARHLLASKHLALSDCIRLHRSKGLVVTLSSQSPDDYDGAGDDYLENIGLPICFKTNAKSTQVLQNMFKAKVSFASLAKGMCLTLKDSKSTKVKAF